MRVVDSFSGKDEASTTLPNMCRDRFRMEKLCAAECGTYLQNIVLVFVWEVCSVWEFHTLDNGIIIMTTKGEGWK